MDRKDIREIGRKTLHKGRLAVARIEVEVPRFSSGKRMKVSREIAMRADAAAALVHDKQRDVFIFAEQFRVPAYLHGEGWMLELVAGKLDEGETPEETLRREMEEEIGYRAGTLEPICTYFPAPGYSQERMFLFYAPVTAKDLVKPDAHGVDEGEDIRRVELPRAEFLDRLGGGDFQDGKILALSGWAVARFAR
jgi:ADP-ribose pyrophosphatase